MKSNIHKKITFEDKFDRKYACWVKNNRKAWHYWKRRNRKLFRIKINKEKCSAENEDVFTRKEELSKEESEWLIDFITKEGGAI